MKFIKLDLLTLLISLFLFASCENTSTIGLEIDPSTNVQGALVDTVTISSRTVKDDVVSTVGALRYPLGFLKDPTFGTTEASIAMTVNLPYNAFSFGDNPVIDSAVLVLNYGGQFYGDSTATYRYDVHQLSVNLSRETSFLSSRTYPYLSPLLGTKSGKIYPSTPYKVTDVVAGKADTMRVATPQLRIRLDNAFITNTFFNAGSGNLANNTVFTRYLGGLHVQLNKTGSTGNGGLSFLDFENSVSAVSIYYKKNNSTSGLIDTMNVNFPITGGVAASPIAATITHDYTSTPVAVQLANPNTQYPITYLQPMAGVRSKISFPYLSKFAANVGKIVVNKAELVIDASAGADIVPFNTAPRLALYRNDIAERRQNVPDNNMPSQLNPTGDARALSPAVFGGYYNSITRQYVFVITSYVQDLLNGKLTDYGTFLVPTPSSEFEVNPSIGTAARSVIGAFKKNPVAGDNVMKLNIYYTKVN